MFGYGTLLLSAASVRVREESLLLVIGVRLIVPSLLITMPTKKRKGVKKVRGWVGISDSDEYVYFSRVPIGDGNYSLAGWIRHFPAVITYKPKVGR